MKMKRVFFVSMGICMSIFLHMNVSAATTPDLSVLSKSELETFQEELAKEVTDDHEPDNSGKDTVKDALTEYVDNYYNEKNYDVDWPWFDYEYTRDWNFYTIETEISFKNRDDKHDKGKVKLYAEYQLGRSGEAQLGYLMFDEETIEDKRSSLPSDKWDGSGTDKVLSSVTGINLYTLERDELESTISAVKTEIAEVHTPRTIVTDLFLAIVKYQIENTYHDVEWSGDSLFGEAYTFTCDWDFYTLKCEVSYKSEDDKKQKANLYAEAYPYEEYYRVVFLTVGEEILVDYRDTLPESLYKVATKTGKASDEEETNLLYEEITELQTETITEIQTEAITEVQTEEFTKKQIETEIVQETEPVTESEIPEESTEEFSTEMKISESETMVSETEAVTEKKDEVLFEKGARNDSIKAVQTKLIALGFLKGNADGIFGDMTAAALRDYQETHGLPETGAITQETLEKINQEHIPETERVQSVQTEAPEKSERMVWVSNTGHKYHSNSGCSNMNNPSQVPISTAEAMGLGPCARCY